MSAETKNDFDALVVRLGGSALFDMIAGKKTWHNLVHGIAFGTAQWAAETITNPIRKERDAALAVLEAVKKSLEPAYVEPPPPLSDGRKFCRYCQAALYESGIGEGHSETCIYQKVCKALEAKKS